ncbi:hypothetical protein GCM10010472_71730 [Pseudonocardia halophobica]|uniref:Uncharacterized protein n=1 Tax=Pseudonocardia halophobica TaxID=29401 RepID=A0A9W6L2L9_9PSEU|nr:DUF4231 domain-containing protein [Pseudonocardia halophobica]GLL10955.1 hypothetical protein GCM10017577_20960 [Pseudonocardia halophobica]
MRRPALLARFPSLRPVRARNRSVLAPAVAAEYPQLAADIELADEIVGPEFGAADHAALRQQNRYRRQQVVIILGTAVLTGLGGLQAVFPEERWPGIMLAVLGLLLAFAGRAAGELRALDTFLDERIKAERLKSAYFRYLSRTGRYADEDRTTRLRRAVVAIKRGEEPV